MPLAVVALIAVVLVSLAVGALVLVRRRVGLPFLESHNEVAGHVYAVLGAIYGVLLAFVVATVWQRYVEAGEIVEREANAVADLYRSAAVYPPGMRQRARAHLKAYARLVPQQEWHGRSDSAGSTEAWRAYKALWRQYVAYSPVTARERIWHQQSVEHLNRLGDERRLRLLHSQPAIPPLLWVVLGAVGIVTVAFSYFFGVQSLWSHALMTGALAGVIGLILVLLIALERPFEGVARIHPHAFREVLRLMQY